MWQCVCVGEREKNNSSEVLCSCILIYKRFLVFSYIFIPDYYFNVYYTYYKCYMWLEIECSDFETSRPWSMPEQSL